MCQKWEGESGLWVLNEITKKTYTESLKKKSLRTALPFLTHNISATGGV